MGLITLLAARSAGGVVALQATSATVQNPGDTAQICVVLSTGGQQVAGTGNDLAWDGTCATLADKNNCRVVGSHGKQLSGALNPQGQDFSYRGLILSFSDVDPIPDGPLYCCSFQGEANPGECCSIRVTNTQGSTSGSQPQAIAVAGNTAQLCTAQSSGQTGRGIGSINGTGQPLSASNAPADGGTGSGATTSAPAAPAAPAGGAAPPVQVLPGGGTRVENPAAGAGAPPIQAPALAQAPGQPGAGTPPPTGAPTAAVTRAPIAPATSAPTPATTKQPTPADTPTVHPPVAPSTAPTKAGAAVKPQAAAPPADTASSTGLFGCQIASGTSGVPLVGLGLLALVGRAVRGRRGRRRQSDSRTQRWRGGYVDDDE